MRKFTLILMAAVALTAASVAGVQAAILNSLRGFDENEPGWSGSIAGSYRASGGNTSESTFDGSGRLQLRSASNVWRLIASGRRTTSSGVETARSTLGHLRHNYLLSDRWATLAFAQSQVNPFQKLDSRYLLGLGARWKALTGKSTALYLGAATMFEQEKIEGEEGDRNTQRFSGYVSLEADLREGVIIDFLAFYQPKWSDPSDWRFWGEVGLEIELTGSLSLFTSYTLEHNSLPPSEVEQTDWYTKTGFIFKF